MREDYVLVKGNEAIAEAALRAGCRFYAGYPITPQSEILEYMADHMEERGGVFIQGENEYAVRCGRLRCPLHVQFFRSGL